MLSTSLSLPEASVLPSGLYSTQLTGPVCPWRVAFSLPVTTSQSLIVLSRLAEASVLPSGLKATHFTTSVCPLRAAWHLSVACSGPRFGFIAHPRCGGHSSSSTRLRRPFLPLPGTR